MDKKKINKKENGEDATKYGEFVSSFFGWITPRHQKEKAEELENLGRTKSVKKDRVLNNLAQYLKKNKDMMRY